MASAIIAAERMVDYMEKPTHSHKGETSSKQQNGKGGEQKKGEEHATKAGNKPGKPNKGNWGSFICGGPHRARDCPKKEKWSALIADDGQEGV